MEAQLLVGSTLGEREKSQVLNFFSLLCLISFSGGIEVTQQFVIVYDILLYSSTSAKRFH
jgi:hypothetical protein